MIVGFIIGVNGSAIAGYMMAELFGRGPTGSVVGKFVTLGLFFILGPIAGFLSAYVVAIPLGFVYSFDFTTRAGTYGVLGGLAGWLLGASITIVRGFLHS
ncbi:MAG: hypothetical protein HC893_02000 [Chloroflexaceae bacterium]|nr:hypothetical protein [Chloroflexaceae bacterium]NJL32839.1 hypothetical protein [Chloroflexaceae bacterium]NJO05566.1 hypothetical protein [Chloroflexaceae bacterium]